MLINCLCATVLCTVIISDVNKANSVKAKARQYDAKARGLQGQGLTLQNIKSRS